MTKTKANPLEAATTVPTFQQLVEAGVKVANERTAGREKAEAILNVAREAEAEQRRALTRLNKILYLSRLTTNVMEWQEREGCVGVKKIVGLETPDYHFDIFLSETSLKKTPYEVVARLWKTELSANPQETHGGYRMTDYGKEKYGDAIEARYKTLALAEEAIELWKDTLYKDHGAEIDFCRYLRKLAIADGAEFNDGDNLVPLNRRGNGR